MLHSLGFTSKSGVQVKQTAGANNYCVEDTGATVDVIEGCAIVFANFPSLSARKSMKCTKPLTVPPTVAGRASQFHYLTVCYLGSISTSCLGGSFSCVHSSPT